jgi:ABC-type lipoprotein export system ATPase subunit/GNAT superfamily N-acetyltransferase
VIPPAELVDVERLRVDGDNPNRLSVRRFEALKKSIRRWGFVVPVITNRDLLVADGEHRLRAAKELGMKRVSVVRLPVDDVDRRLLRQVMNKLRGEHDLYLDAEEYYRLVSEDQRSLLKTYLNETDLRIDNLLKLRQPFDYSNEEFNAAAEKFASKIESNRMDEDSKVSLGEPLTLTCHVEFSTKAEVTKRTLAVCEAFGLGVDEAKRFVVFDNFSLDFRRGNLIYITGDSGGGKTLLLSAFRRFFGDEAVALDDLGIDPEETLVEGVGEDVTEAIRVLSFCGLNDAFLFLRRFKELSDGQKYRYKLAKLMDMKKRVWIVDEFCAALDPVMARIISFLLQKVARRLGKTVVVATTHPGLVEDFQPDILIEKGYEKDVQVIKNSFSRKPCSIYENISIEKACLDDYRELSVFHYKTKGQNKPERLRVKDCYKLLFGGKLVGVIVYSPSYLNLKPRNMVFGKRYIYTPGDLHTARLINEEIARISRVVVHPKFRGIGLGAYLVKETLPKVDAKVVEVLAVMAKYNPFFEKAGMLRVDYSRDLSGEEKKIRQFLESLDFDFDFVKSRTYCNIFYAKLTPENKKKLLTLLTDFAHQPFIKTNKITPYLLTKTFNSEATYLYWINNVAFSKET